MKLRVLAASMLVLALCAAPGAHAAAGAQTFGINAGVALPMGDFSDAAGTGFFGGVTYTYHVNEQFGLGGDVNYVMFGKKSYDIPYFDGVSITTLRVDATPHILQFGAHGKYFFPMKDAKMAPYAKVGLGMYNLGVKVEGGGFSTTSSESKFGFAFGLGSTMKMNDKASWGLEAMYHMIQTEGSSTSMVTAALSYNFSMGK